MSVSYVRLAGQTGSSLLGCCFLAANVNYEELCLSLSDITGLPPTDYPSLHILLFQNRSLLYQPPPPTLPTCWSLDHLFPHTGWPPRVRQRLEMFLGADVSAEVSLHLEAGLRHDGPLAGPLSVERHVAVCGPAGGL